MNFTKHFTSQKREEFHRTIFSEIYVPDESDIKSEN